MDRTSMPSISYFFIVGPLRTGSSLITRCLDDHEEAICLCESEIARALFRDYFLRLHFRRMETHGLSIQQTVDLLDRRKQDDPISLMSWYASSLELLSTLHQKPSVIAYGDKSPDFFRYKQLVSFLADNHRLIYTVRDPRAIYRSITSQTDASPAEKEERWGDLVRNFLVWEPYLDRDSVHCVRYEDLVANPAESMATVYRHVGLAPSTRFLTPFPRRFPRRFLWKTAVDWETGIRREFDVTRLDWWQSELTRSDLRTIDETEHVPRFMKRFGYK